MPVKKNKKTETWLDSLPRGMKKKLADKYNMTTTAVTYILRREDVINHPEMLKDARDAALEAMRNKQEHNEALNHAISE